MNTTPKFHLDSPASRKLTSSLHEQVKIELAEIFPDAESGCVHDVLQGFQPDQQTKVILAVETTTVKDTKKTFEAHVVKIGHQDDVASDVAGWEECVSANRMQRMFVDVWKRVLSNDRCAVVYQDASHWHGRLTQNDEVASLVWATEAAVSGNGIDTDSVTRIIRQVFDELGRALYSNKPDRQDLAENFYREKLRIHASGNYPADQNVYLWNTYRFLKLRHDADWLLTDSAFSDGDAALYIDPFNFVMGMLDDEFPLTKVGPSHGDLHAGNILVGVAGPEVEYPLIIDYGDMRIDNVIAWDFAKLETELKVRLLARLSQDANACETLWKEARRNPQLNKIMNNWTTPARIGLRSADDRIKQIVFAFQFERLVQENTGEFFRTKNQLSDPSATSTPLERAAAIIGSIRIHAAKQLNDNRRTQDEFDFAMAVYGLSTSKYPETAYDIDQRQFALISAGMAAARIAAAVETSFDTTTRATDVANFPTFQYKPFVDWAHRNWSEGRNIQESRDLLNSLQGQFKYSVNFLSTLSLLETRLERFDQAFEALEDIDQDDFKPFGDHETPSRIAAAWKKKADLRWEKSKLSFDELSKGPGQTPVIWYRIAYKNYRTAFEISSSYYPGGNAVVTGFLANVDARSEIADRVLAECETAMIDAKTNVDRYWILATQGDIALIQGDNNVADLYQAALDELPAEKLGMVQTTYDQICRLYKVFEAQDVGPIAPVLDVFASQTKFRLQPGPLGNCGNLL